MENLTFSTWTLSQTHSFIIAMANAKVNSGAVDYPASFDDVMSDVYKELNRIVYYIHDGASSVTYGNFVVTINSKARKVGLLNTRNGKFVETYCNKKDKFDVFTGLGVLWAKYNHIERPKFEVKKKLSEVKPHEIFRWGCNRYEFIGTADNRSKDGKKYIILRLSDDTICQFYEDTVIVEE
jgi:hypothetical protein